MRFCRPAIAERQENLNRAAGFYSSQNLRAAPEDLVKKTDATRAIGTVHGQRPAKERLKRTGGLHHRELTCGNLYVLSEGQREKVIARRKLFVALGRCNGFAHHSGMCQTMRAWRPTWLDCGSVPDNFRKSVYQDDWV